MAQAPQDPHVFGPQDPEPDPLVRGTDPDPSIIKPKNLDSYCFVTFFYFLYLKNDINVPSKSTY